MPDVQNQQIPTDQIPLSPQSSSKMPAYGSNLESSMVAETLPVIELTPERQENLPKAEIPIPTALKEVNETVKSTTTISFKSSDTVINTVVPKVETKKPPLHHIEHPANDLTQKADAEEEDFIKHVEEIHTLL